MVDYLERMIIEMINLPSTVSLRSLDIEEQGRYWLTSDSQLLSVCRQQARYKHFTDNGHGYYYVDINGSRYYLHRLVALTFNQDQEKKKIYNNCVVHHMDRNKDNNLMGNLCIMTNRKHRAIHTVWNKIDKGVIPWEQLQIN